MRAFTLSLRFRLLLPPRPPHRAPDLARPACLRADDGGHQRESRRLGQRTVARRDAGGAVACPPGLPANDQRRGRQLPLPASDARRLRGLGPPSGLPGRLATGGARRSRRGRLGAPDAQGAGGGRGRGDGRDAAHRHGKHEDRDLTDRRRHLPAASRPQLRLRHDDGRRDEPGRPRIHDLRRHGSREPVPHRRGQHDGGALRQPGQGPQRRVHPGGRGPDGQATRPSSARSSAGTSTSSRNRAETSSTATSSGTTTASLWPRRTRTSTTPSRRTRR